MNNTAFVEFDFESLPIGEIPLSSEDIQQALAISQHSYQSKQWETYLNALGLFAVKTWLCERVNSLAVNQDDCTLLQPDLSNYINAVSNLQAGNFKLCLIVIGSLTNEKVTLPQFVIDLPEFIAHFYVIIEVFEEEEFAVISGFLPYKQVIENLQRSEQGYKLPLSCLDKNTDNLLIYLQCLQPEAIPLPAVTRNRNLSDIVKLISEPTLNVARWLRNELDQIGQEFSWMLLPSLAPAPMRSPSQEYSVIVTQIKRQGLEIPQQARGAYQDLVLAGEVLRLYAVTWITSPNQQEWTLLLILGTPSFDRIQHNLKMRVSDREGILVEKELSSSSNDSYIFTRIVGTLDEKFIVTVGLVDGVETTLPPFAFDLTK